MFLRNSADVRPLLWLTMAVGLLMVEYRWSWLVFLFFPLNMYLAVCAGVIAHNHNHCPVFSSRRANGWLGHLLTFFYGYPTFAWVPTHNLNHHKHVNRAGDATITWRVSDKHDFWTAWSYFFVSSYHQAAPIKTFLRKAREKNPGLYRRIQWQYGVWLGVWAAVWLLASTCTARGAARCFGFSASAGRRSYRFGPSCSSTTSSMCTPIPGRRTITRATSPADC